MRQGGKIVVAPSILSVWLIAFYKDIPDCIPVEASRRGKLQVWFLHVCSES